MGIIRNTDKTKHSISPYIFGELDKTQIIKEQNSDDGFEPLYSNKNLNSQKNQTQQTTNSITSSATNIEKDREQQDKMVSILLEKSDKLSEELIKVQGKLTTQEGLFRDEMKRSKDDSYVKGVRDGETKAHTEIDNFYKAKLSQLESSIKKLDELSKNFSSLLNGFEKELVQTSIEIAKEVIESELSFNSGSVAINLSNALIKKIEEAKEIKIHVNNNDYESVRVGLSNLKNITIISDNAVTKGGVIISSDIGSIEGNVMQRYKKLKNSILSKIDN